MAFWKKKEKKQEKKKDSIWKRIKNRIVIDKSMDVYSVKEVIIIMIFSMGIGFASCFGFISFFTGKNYISIISDLGKVVDTYYAIVDNYYGDLDKNALVDGAVNGMISSVGDSFTSYSNASDAEDFDETINGSYEGIGATVATYSDGRIVIIDIFDNSPSDVAGLKVGDVVKKIDDESFEGKNGTDMAEYIKNVKKDKIVMTILRDEEEKNITISLGKVEVPSVTGEVIEKNNKKIGYIKISIFASNSYKQFNDKLKELEKGKIDGLIIDVRDNSGGYLSCATDISSLFLEKGKVIYQLEDAKGIVKTVDKTSEKRTYPVSVIINRASASASEILASMFKESYGGYVVGTNSYGKGSVQQTKKLLDGSMIKYTTQKWLTPNGNSINGVGVIPTDAVELSEKYYSNPSMDTDDQLQAALNLLVK